MQAETDSEITVKAVVAYAAKLQLAATAECVRDPYAKPYSPSLNYARWLSSKEGPARALAILREQAMLYGRAQREQVEASRRSLERHKRRQAEARKDRERKVSNLRPGERIDLAFAQWSLVASPEAANPEPSSPSCNPVPVIGLPTSDQDKLYREAVKLALKIEQELYDAQARNMQQIAA